MSFEFDTKAFERGLVAGVAEYERLGERALDDLADDVVSTAKQLAPFETGTLAGSIEVRGKGRDADGPYVDYGTDDPVGIYQEYGTVNMDAHPFMRPAVAQAEPKFGSRLNV